MDPSVPSNGRKTSKCGGILTKKQSAALTLEARIMNFILLNPQVIPHRTGPSRLPMSAYRLVCMSVCLSVYRCQSMMEEQLNFS